MKKLIILAGASHRRNSMLRFFAVMSVLSLIVSTPVLAEDDHIPSSTPQVEIDPLPTSATKYAVPGTGGLLWGSGQNSLAPANSMGVSLGVTLPPQPPTRTYCNGRPC
jgi:hypothetical protein